VITIETSWQAVCLKQLNAFEKILHQCAEVGLLRHHKIQCNVGNWQVLQAKFMSGTLYTTGDICGIGIYGCDCTAFTVALCTDFKICDSLTLNLAQILQQPFGTGIVLAHGPAQVLTFDQIVAGFN